MQIDHHGARDGVTGSCHQLHIDEHISLLIDCGLFQGKETGNSRERHDIEFDIGSVQALIATHVHIDHVGRIPWLLAAGFDGPIICSQPSATLLPLVLEDAFKLGISRDKAVVERYLKQIESRIIALPYKEWFTLVDSQAHKVRIRLQRAGHILGSAYVEVDMTSCSEKAPAEPAGNNADCGGELCERKNTRIVFSGDLGASHTPLLPAPEPPEKADILVLESTYGDRNHEDRATRKHRLKAAIDRALQNNGTVLIPAFSIGRTQELLYELEELTGQLSRSESTPTDSSSGANGCGSSPCGRTNDAPEAPIPVILDSPLASRFTAAYRELKSFWDEEACARLKQGRKPLAFETMLTVDSYHEHLKMVHHLAQSGRPAIVIAGSGMCNAGRIVNYLKAMLGNERHDVLFVGYQAEGTPGHAIQQYGPRNGWVLLDGERYDIRARVETIGGYSAHADQQGLVNFVTGMQHAPAQIRLVHGDKSAKQTLKTALQQVCAAETEFQT